METRVEPALVKPEQEKKFCLEQLKDIDKERKLREKELEKVRKGREFSVQITVTADGEPVPLVGADGKEYDKIEYKCEGDNVASFLAQGAVFLKKVMGSRKNDTVRLGSIIHGLDKQAKAYTVRLERAQRHIDEANRRANGGA